MAERVASAAAAKCLARPRLRERPGSPRLGGDHAENLAMLLIRSVAVIRMVPRIICVARSPNGQIPPPVRVKRAVELVAARSTPDLRSSTYIFQPQPRGSREVHAGRFARPKLRDSIARRSRKGALGAAGFSVEPASSV
jgi:hypothetical protein